MSPDPSVRGEGWPWAVLGLEGAVDEREVKRAYARTLKEMDRSDVAAFEALRRAFDAARKAAQASDGAAQGAVRPGMADLAARARVAPSKPLQADTPGPTPTSARDGPAKAPVIHPKLDLPRPVSSGIPTVAPVEPLPSPRPVEKPKGRTRSVLTPHTPAATAQSHDLVTEVIGPKIVAAIEAFDAPALREALLFVEGMDRDGRARSEVVVIHALNTEPSRISRDIALAIDAVFDWSSDALVTERTIRRTIGSSPVYARFVAAVLTKAQSAAPAAAAVPKDAPVEPVEPEGVVSLVAVVLTLIQAGLETWGSDANGFFTFAVVLISAWISLVLLAIAVLAVLYPLRWVKRLLTNVTPPKSRARRLVAKWDLWMLGRRITPRTVALGTALLVFFGFAWIVQPMMG